MASNPRRPSETHGRQSADLTAPSRGGDESKGSETAQPPIRTAMPPSCKQRRPCPRLRRPRNFSLTPAGAFPGSSQPAPQATPEPRLPAVPALRQKAPCDWLFAMPAASGAASRCGRRGCARADGERWVGIVSVRVCVSLARNGNGAVAGPGLRYCSAGRRAPGPGGLLPPARGAAGGAGGRGAAGCGPGWAARRDRPAATQ